MEALAAFVLPGIPAPLSCHESVGTLGTPECGALIYSKDKSGCRLHLTFNFLTFLKFHGQHNLHGSLAVLNMHPK